MRFFHLTQPALVDTRALGLSYDAVGATERTPPAGWHVDRLDGPLGTGDAVFDAARAATFALRMFDLPWVRLLSAPRVEAGADLVFTARTLGIWTLNACRVVYVVDEADAGTARVGFGYGTLDAHALRGEERFMTTLDRVTGAVTFEVLKFSRPRHPVVRLALPFARTVQRRFSRDALAAMQRAVRGG